MFLFLILIFLTLPTASTRKKYTNIHITLAAFGQTLLALKIYSTRYVHYRFSALMAFARRNHWVNSFMQSLLQKVSFYLCLCAMNNEDKMIPSAAVTA